MLQKTDEIAVTFPFRARQLLSWCVLWLFVWPAVGIGDPFLLFDSRDRFIAQTDAMQISDTFNTAVDVSGSIVSGEVEYRSSDSSTLQFRDWPVDFTGDEDIELAIDGPENLNISVLTGPINALGFDFDGALTPTESGSSMIVTVFNGAERVGAVDVPLPFLSPQGVIAPTERFIGIWSRQVFDRLEIRDSEGAPADEYFGAVYAAQRNVPTIPRKSIPDPALGPLTIVGPFDPQAERVIAQANETQSYMVLRKTPDQYWMLDGHLEDRDTVENRFGIGRALSGNNLVLLAKGEEGTDSFPWRAYFYERQDGEWLSSTTLLPENGEDGAQTLTDIDLDGDRAIVRNNSSEVWVVERQATGEWSRVASLFPQPTIPSEDGLNISFISLDGDTAAVVGGSREIVEIYVFDRQQDGAWLQTAALSTGGVPFLERFAEFVSIDGDRIVTGWRRGGIAGSTGVGFLYERRLDGTWQGPAFLSPRYRGNSGPRFPLNASLRGDWAFLTSSVGGVVLSAPLPTQVFHRGSEKSWPKVGELAPPDFLGLLNANPFVSSGSRFFVNYKQANGTGFYTGAVYEFVITLTEDGFEADSSPQ